ncbi:MAG: hypothetical protein R3359_12110 [Marinirhabdus sp.]|nr:hypothetical protein [Marinirhabdus sp.]
MASVRELKRDINYVLGDIIEAVYIWELTHPEKDTKKSQAIIDDAITAFDELIVKVNDRSVAKEDKRAHYKAINAELETRGRKLIDDINTL